MLVRVEEKFAGRWGNTFGRRCFGFIASFSPRFLVIVATLGAVGVLFCLCWAGHWDEGRTKGVGGGEDGNDEVGEKNKQQMREIYPC